MEARSMKVGTRLALGFGSISLLLCLILAVGTIKQSTLNDGTSAIIQDRWPKIGMSNEILTQTDRIAIALRNMMLTESKEDRQKQVEDILAARKTTASDFGKLEKSLLKQLGGEPEYAASVATRIAAGDIAVEVAIRPNDQSSMLHAMRSMRDNLGTIVTQVRQGTEAITTASSEIASGNLDLSSRTEEQASSLEETASSMEELTSTVKQNADNARQANQLAASASEVKIKGGAVVSQVVDTMGAINASSRKIIDIMGEITAASQEQTAGIEQINQAIVQMDQVTQQNAALAEEATAALEAMQDQAGRLLQVVSTFRLSGQQAVLAPAA